MVRLETQLSTWGYNSDIEDKNQFTKGEQSCDDDDDTPTIEADLEESKGNHKDK